MKKAITLLLMVAFIGGCILMKYDRLLADVIQTDSGKIIKFSSDELLTWSVIRQDQIGISYEGFPVVLEVIINPNENHHIKAVGIITEWKPSGRYIFFYCYELDDD